MTILGHARAAAPSAAPDETQRVVLVDEAALLGGANRRPGITCASSRGGPIGIWVKGIWVGGRRVQHATETMDLLNPTPTQCRAISRSPRSDCGLRRLPTDARGTIWVSQSCLGRVEWRYLGEVRTPIRGTEFRRAKTAKVLIPFRRRQKARRFDQATERTTGSMQLPTW